MLVGRLADKAEFFLSFASFLLRLNFLRRLSEPFFLDVFQRFVACFFSGHSALPNKKAVCASQRSPRCSHRLHLLGWVGWSQLTIFERFVYASTRWRHQTTAVFRLAGYSIARLSADVNVHRQGMGQQARHLGWVRMSLVMPDGKAPFTVLAALAHVLQASSASQSRATICINRESTKCRCLPRPASSAVEQPRLCQKPGIRPEPQLLSSTKTIPAVPPREAPKPTSPTSPFPVIEAWIWT